PSRAGEGRLRGRGAHVRPCRRHSVLRPGLRGAGPRAGRTDHPGTHRRGGPPVPRRAPSPVRLRLRRRRQSTGGVGQPPRRRHRRDPTPRAGRPRHPGGRPGPGACVPPPGVLRRGTGLCGHTDLLASRSLPRSGPPRPGDRGGVRGHGAVAPRIHRPRRRLPQHHRDPEGTGMNTTVKGRRVPTQFPFGSLTADAGASADPVLVEIVQGSLASVEMEVETAIARTSRSPMIRDAHDFRAGIHDRLLRKLTGRSYSALVHPVVRDFPLEEMRPGDVFFHNDVYESEGGIGHLPDLCVTVPVFHDSGNGPEVVAFVQAFGHHDDIGGAVPGSMPSNATSVYEEGLMVPPIRLWGEGKPNRAALRIMTRNSRMPESLAADLDAECAACLMGARRLGELFDRYGRDTVEACFDAIISRTTQTYRREILSKIPVGTWVWEDYAEHDGVEEPKLHRQ